MLCPRRHVRVPRHDDLRFATHRFADRPALKRTARAVLGQTAASEVDLCTETIKGTESAALDPTAQPHEDVREPSAPLNQRVTLVTVSEEQTDPVGFVQQPVGRSKSPSNEIVVAVNITVVVAPKAPSNLGMGRLRSFEFEQSFAQPRGRQGLPDVAEQDY